MALQLSEINYQSSCCFKKFYIFINMYVFFINLSRYSSRVNYDVACAMDFHRYPVDDQTCEIKFESFGYTSKQVSSLS